MMYLNCLQNLPREMSTLVLGSTKVSAQKMKDAGYAFKFPELEKALKQIYSS
jgi:uncharacterized protein